MSDVRKLYVGSKIFIRAYDGIARNSWAAVTGLQITPKHTIVVCRELVEHKDGSASSHYRSFDVTKLDFE